MCPAQHDRNIAATLNVPAARWDRDASGDNFRLIRTARQKVADLAAGHGLAEKITLHRVAAEIAQDLHLAFGFDTLDNTVDVQILAKTHHGLDDIAAGVGRFYGRLREMSLQNSRTALPPCPIPLERRSQSCRKHTVNTRLAFNRRLIHGNLLRIRR